MAHAAATHDRARTLMLGDPLCDALALPRATSASLRAAVAASLAGVRAYARLLDLPVVGACLEALHGVVMRLARCCSRGRAERYALKATKNASETDAGLASRAKHGCPFKR